MNYVTKYSYKNAARLLFVFVLGLALGGYGTSGNVVPHTSEMLTGPQLLIAPIGALNARINQNNVLRIDRSEPLDPEEVLGPGWTFEDEDQKALKLTEVNVSKISLETTLKSGERNLNGEERLRRLKASGKIRLDLAVLIAFAMQPNHIPVEWKTLTNGGRAGIFFDGTVCKAPDGRRITFCLFWDRGQWQAGGLLLKDNHWGTISPSALY